jgi:hypothetical protein
MPQAGRFPRTDPPVKRSPVWSGQSNRTTLNV